MKKRKVYVLLILIVVFVLAVGWKRTDPVEHPKAALTFDEQPDL